MNLPKLAITIDVEGKMKTREYNTMYRLDEFLESITSPTTLFVTPGAANNNNNLVEKWRDNGHEIGLHIHPERFQGCNSGFLMEYPNTRIADFLNDGKQGLSEIIGTYPKSFRAGRWSYSPRLLELLGDADFKIDSSLRPEQTVPIFEGFGVREIPLTVYSNELVSMLLRGKDVNSIPFALDALLKSGFRAIGIYFLTLFALSSNPPYLMVALHDYDLENSRLKNRIIRFVNVLSGMTNPVTISEI